MPANAQILLVEDESGIAQFIYEGLTEEKYQVRWAPTGTEALKIINHWSADLLILDIRLPDINGIEICQKTRLLYPAVPILMLTALDAIEDRVRGLRAGADDYLPKPFAFEELLARIEALLRRPGRTRTGNILQDGMLFLDVSNRTCRVDSQPIELTSTELELLAYFMRHKHQLLSRERLHAEVWGLHFDRGTNLIDVYVSYLRKKLRKAGCTQAIETVRGQGYRFTGCQSG